MIWIATTALFYFFLALILALAEIEVEGKFGWAEKLPTWYRTKGWGKLFGLVTQSRPLTGYHLFINGFVLIFCHIGFFNGAVWTFGTELTLLSRYVVFAALWDFLWFVFNPEYGLKRFKKSQIWWHSKCHWIFGIMPGDYLNAFVVSTILASLGIIFEGTNILLNQFVFLGWILGFTAMSTFFAPAYGRWYKWMRRKDERDKAGIFHKGDQTLE